MGGMMLFCLAILGVGVTSVVALGLWVARLIKAARIVFAAGLLCSAAIAAVAALTFLSPEFTHHGTDSSLIVLAALGFLFAAAEFRRRAVLRCTRPHSMRGADRLLARLC